MQARIEHQPAAILPRWPFFRPSGMVVRPENKPVQYCRASEVAQARTINGAVEAADHMGYDRVTVEGVPLAEGVIPPSLQTPGEEERWRVMIDDYELVAVCDTPDELAKKVDHMEYVHGPDAVHCLVERGGLTAAELAGRVGDRLSPRSGYDVYFDEREATCHLPGVDRSVSIRFDTDGALLADLLTDEGPDTTAEIRAEIDSVLEAHGFRHTFAATGQQPKSHAPAKWDGPGFGVGLGAAADSGHDTGPEPATFGRPVTAGAEDEPEAVAPR